MPAKKDSSIIDITGLAERLRVAEPPPARVIITQTSANFHHYETRDLGQMYAEPLGLTARQVGWLNKFYQPDNAFMGIEAARRATVLLYVTALLAIDQQLKITGTTLAKEVTFLDDKARSLRHYAYYWQPSSSTVGDKAGADVYLALFRQCENAVRAHFDAGRAAPLFVRNLAQLLPLYQTLLGQHVQQLLPAMIAQVPPPDEATERALNLQNPNRWKATYDKLLPLLPAKAPRFIKAVTQLAARNEDNPKVGTLYFEAAKQLAKLDREAALRFYLRHVAQEQQFYEPRVKPLPKTLRKALLPKAEQQPKFEALVHELEAFKNLPAVLAKVPGVYEVPRRRLALDQEAIHAVRDQHAGTVALLNDYLRDEPAPTPAAEAQAQPAKPAKTAKATKPAKPVKPAQPAKTAQASRPAPSPPPTPTPPAGAGPFAADLDLDAPQRALLLRFAAHDLRLARAAVEAFATAHGRLRNQLIDGLNDSCYARLDDVLIEEADDAYTIYPPYYQQLLA